jgi:hypothetical protein
MPARAVNEHQLGNQDRDDSDNCRRRQRLLGGEHERQDRFEIDAEPREEGAAPQSLLQQDERAEINGPRHTAILDRVIDIAERSTQNAHSIRSRLDHGRGQ